MELNKTVRKYLALFPRWEKKQEEKARAMFGDNIFQCSKCKKWGKYQGNRLYPKKCSCGEKNI